MKAEPRIRNIVLAAFGVTVVALVGFKGPGSPPAVKAGAGATAGGAPAGGSAGPSYTTASLFAEGVTQEYELDETASVVTTTGQPISTLVLQGGMKFTAVQEQPTVLVRVTFTGTVTATTGAARGGPDDALTESARRPFVLEFTQDGRFVRVSGSRGVLPMVGRAFTSLGESLQLVRPSRGARWESTERDAAGSYVAEYEQQDRLEVTKRKTRYDALTSTAMTSYDVLASRATFTVDPGAHLTKYTLDEKTRVVLESMPGFSGATRLSLAFTRSEVSSTHLDAWVAEAKAATPLAATMHDQQEEARDRERIGGMTPAEVFDHLGAFSKEGASRGARDGAGRAFVALSAMLRRDPAMLARVKAHLDARGPDTDVMLAALRDASTPAAQRLLADMSGTASPLAHAERLEAARSLSRVEKPTAETVESLKRLRSDPDVGTQATYGLGSALHRLKDLDPLLADDARKALTDDLGAATTSGERVATLTALGNAGDATTLEEIRRFAASDDPDVRAAAAQALRRIAGPDAESLLAILAADPVATVRSSAVDAIGERTASRVLSDALIPVALGDAVFGVRAGAVTVLARWLDALPYLAETLQRVATSDPHQDPRNTAKAALAMRDRLAKAARTNAK